MTDDPSDGTWSPLCRVDEIREREGRSFVVDHRAVALFRHGGRCFAVTDRCPHNGMPLHDGNVENGVVTCRWHGWSFDLTSGRTPGASSCGDGPRLRVYPLRIRDGWIEIRLDAPFDRPRPSTPPVP